MEVTAQVKDSIYSTAFNFILQDVKINLTKESRKKFGIHVSSELVPFHLSSFDISIIIFNYIENYSFSYKPDKRDKTIINHVLDSLSHLDDIFDKNFQKKSNSYLNKLTTGRRINQVLFFSDLIDNHLYAEIGEWNNKLPTDMELVYYGKFKTYLFVLDDTGNIVKIYTGYIHYN